ncbi:hypothetical protein ACELLULO517_24550 [Acidisoma cellulosilytica]|uniref:Lipoprotein n=1 Tax=Acidisoma cellulosilyticum TaxID=2802395 RepID=A0A964E6D1_9PROT|nr:hypothetical protein [Acidisoma cellulosilyticum]MCB8883441.1 hypothetical protein [Acidisoma cellulosilyticum]
MKRVFIVATLLLLAGCAVNASTIVAPRPSASADSDAVTVNATVAAGRQVQLNKIFFLNPDCTLIGYAEIRVGAAPAHGTVTVQQGDFYAAYPASNQRYACNLKPQGGVTTFYRAAPGYTGPDSLTLDVVAPNGRIRLETFHLNVQ